jgi:pimeloyl-ACP methyl ester carboxylesterase
MSAMVRGATPGVEIEALVEGQGPDVVLLPSAGRGASDFALLQAALTAAGYRSVAVNFRGAGKSRGPAGELSFAEVADDVASVIRELCDAPVHLVGHALGNTVARAVASYHPGLVRTLTIMPCGGHDLGAHPVAPAVLAHFPRCHDMSLSREERLESLRVCFFAPGNDASVWLDGWHPAAGQVAAAMQRSDPKTWWRGGSGPVLVIHPLQDAMQSVAASRAFVEAVGARATYVEVADCGHAILPEQPALIAEHLIRFLRAHS